MKRLLLPLLAAIALPSSICAEPIPKISDYELSAEIAEKIEFKCPVKRERDKKEKRIKVTKLYEECWFQLNADHINLMDMQKINKKNIISYSHMIDTNGEGDAIGAHFFIYKANDGTLKRIEINTKTKLFARNWWKEHKKINEAINIWMNN